MLTLQGTENQIDEVLRPLGLLPSDSARFLKTAIRSNINSLLVETRVYLVTNIDSIGLMSDILNGDKHHSELTDDEFMTLAEEDGGVYTLQGFQEAFNNGDVSSVADVIRVITVPIQQK